MFAPVAKIPRLGSFNYFQAGDAMSQLGNVAHGMQQMGNRFGNTPRQSQEPEDLKTLSSLLYGVGIAGVVLGVAGAVSLFFYTGFLGVIGILGLLIVIGAAGFLAAKDIPLVLWGVGLQVIGPVLITLGTFVSESDEN